MMALPSKMNEKAVTATTTYNHQNPKREDIKTKSAKSNHEQWKDKLRSDCIARAQNARREKIQQARRRRSDDQQQHHNGGGVASSSIASSSCCNNNDIPPCRDVAASKRGREMIHNHIISNHNNDDNDQYQRMVDHIPMDYNNVHELRNISSGGVSDEGVLDTARMLVEHELQRALTGLRNCEQMQQGAPSCKKSYHDGSDEDEEEYKISQEEFVALLAEVTEELRREEELLEEELWEVERAEALERERLLHQIDDYDDWQELQQQQQQQSANVYTSPLLTNFNSRVTCPICNSATLIETPFEGIQCTNNTTTTTEETTTPCTFSLDIAHEGLTLNHLQDQLRTVYEEHSNVCKKGILQFRVDSRGGITVLMASCEICHADVVVL